MATEASPDPAKTAILIRTCNFIIKSVTFSSQPLEGKEVGENNIRISNFKKWKLFSMKFNKKFWRRNLYSYSKWKNSVLKFLIKQIKNVSQFSIYEYGSCNCNSGSASSSFMLFSLMVFSNLPFHSSAASSSLYQVYPIP